MDKNIDLIINSKFIGSQQTHRKKSYIILISKRPLYWEFSERESHLATNYRPEGLQRTTHASSERHQWGWWTPSEMVSRLDIVVLDSAAAGWIFRRCFQGSGNIGVFIEQRGGPGAPEVGTTHQGAPGLLARPGGLCRPRDTPQEQPGPVVFLLAHKNSP